MRSFIDSYFKEVSLIASSIDQIEVESVAKEIIDTRSRKGRVFFIGVGGSAGNCSHAVNDFRKLAGVECYAPTDNVSELTARTNDEGWETIFSAWLDVSNLTSNDLIFVFSVGGGNLQLNISPCIVKALEFAKERKTPVVGIVGKDNGYTREIAKASILIPIVNSELITPHSEAFQAVVWHLLVSLPELKQKPTKWESVQTLVNS